MTTIFFPMSWDGLDVIDWVAAHDIPRPFDIAYCGFLFRYDFK